MHLSLYYVPTAADREGIVALARDFSRERPRTKPAEISFYERKNWRQRRGGGYVRGPEVLLGHVRV